ncbi:MAG: hypothetical protein A2629_02580, partial [Candidatus Levybacteria bacterium RIFCSPHIGHO2_01_FULL_41_15]
VGYQALYSNTTGANNTAVGYRALYSNTTGDYNTAVGYSALSLNTTGASNTALGYDAGRTNSGQYYNQTGSNNVYLGYNAGPWTQNASFNNSTAIGAYSLVNASNSLVLGGTAFYAVNVGIGTATPSAVLDIQGGQMGGNAALIVNQTGVSTNDLITASASGTTKFTLSNAGVASLVGGQTADLTSLGNANLTISAGGTGDLRLLSDSDTDILLPYSDFTSEDNSVLYTGVGGKLSALTTTTSGLCIVSAAADNAPTWATCPGGSGGSSNWTLDTTNGLLFPNNNTVDLLVGGRATSSAKFAVLNINSGTPTASVSAGTAGGAFLTADGYLSSTARQTLTIGNSSTYNTTGNVLLNPNGTGKVGIGLTNPNNNIQVLDLINFDATTSGTFLGYRTGYANSGTGSTFVGYEAGFRNTTGVNTAVGYQALDANTTGTANVAIGKFALGANTSASSNTAIGNQALQSNTTGIKNVAIGSTTLLSNTTASHNMAIGFQALTLNTTGAQNAAIGSSTLLSNTTGANNTAIGFQAGYGAPGTGLYANTTGSNNTFIGYNASAFSATQRNNMTAIGVFSVVDQANSLVLGGLGFYAVNVGIGTATPSAVLDIQGGQMGGNAALIVNQTGASANDLFTASASGVTKFTIQNGGTASSAGNFVFDTTGIISTTKKQTLTLGDANTGEIHIYTPAGAKTELLCSNASHGDALALSDASIGDCSNAGQGDIAEYYGSSGDLEPGDLVVMDQNKAPQEVQTDVGHGSKAWVKKSSYPYDNKLIGIVSTNPSRFSLLSDGVFEEEEISVPVALVGRVPVKVSTENGPINIGDVLTSSSVPGVAMKSTRAGQVVGKALQSFDGAQDDIGRIIAFVNVSWSDPSVYITADGTLANTNPLSSEAAALALGLPSVPEAPTIMSNDPVSSASSSSGSFDLASDQNFIDLKNRVASVEAQIESLRSDIINSSTQSAFLQSVLGDTSNVPIASDSAEFVSNLQNLDIQSATISGNLMVLGRTTLSDLGVTGNITAGLLSIHGLDSSANNGDGGATINSIGDLNLQNNQLGGINILAGKVTIDNKGNIKTEGELTVKKVNIDTAASDAASLGSATLLAGQTSVIIETTAVTNKSKVFITPTTKTGNRSLIVSQKSAGTGFTVTIETSYTSDIKFDWWIVDEVHNP